MHIASLAVCMLLVLASLPAAAAGKKYFLTPETFTMGNVRDACGKGYHVASLWEIFDFTALQYDTKRGHALMTGSGGHADRDQPLGRRHEHLQRPAQCLVQAGLRRGVPPPL